MKNSSHTIAAALALALVASAPAHAAESVTFVACSNAVYRWDPVAKFHLDLAFGEVEGGPNHLNLVVEGGLPNPVLTGIRAGDGWALELKVPLFQQEAVHRALGGDASVQVSIDFEGNGPSLSLQNFSITTQAKGECS